MGQLQFYGRVVPAGLKVNGALRDVRFSESNGAYNLTMDVLIQDSQISVSCLYDVEVANFKSVYWTECSVVVQTLVDLIGFQLGAGAISVLERMNEGDVVVDVSLAEPGLPNNCSSIKKYGFNAVVNILFSEPQTFLALNDLILTQIYPRIGLINFARSVEAIRHRVAGPGTNPKVAWPILRDQLNLEEGFISFITSLSADPRHGNPKKVSSETLSDASRRSWIIMDRFFHYRLGGNQKLLVSEFPLLKE